MKTQKILFISLILLIGQVAGVVHAAEVRLFASDGGKFDSFGATVAIDGDSAVVGTTRNQIQGSAYIIVRDGKKWTEQAILNAGAGADHFGESVGISGDYIIGGATGSDDGGDNSGSAYIFMRNGKKWTEQVKLTASDADAGDSFGGSVGISGDYAIVGSRTNDDDGTNSGSAYIFMRNGNKWPEQVKLTASDAAAGDTFGVAVAIDGETAIVGAPQNDHADSNSGAAYIFVLVGKNWIEQAKLTASDAEKSDQFGRAVAINGDSVIISAHGDDDGVKDSGAAYVFFRDGNAWTEQSKLKPNDPAGKDKFGWSVDIAEIGPRKAYAIVGSVWDDDDGDFSGSSYTFLRSGTSWSFRAKQTAGDAAADDEFGTAVAITPSYAIVGARLNDDLGSVYFYEAIDDLALPVEPALLTGTTLGQIKQSALLQNFPNPFNPETWMPYVLAADVPVAIHIYNLSGQLVRQLNLGVQKAGSYLRKENAAYWDGRDQLGGTVPSGIYFYTFKASTFEVTRRMVILK